MSLVDREQLLRREHQWRRRLALNVSCGGPHLVKLEGDEMSDKILQPSDVSVASLREIFDTALLETELDPEGDLMVSDGYRFWVMPSQQGDRIRFMSQFGANSAATPEARLRFVNKVNDELVILRAATNARGSFVFDHYVVVEGGLPAKNLVISARRFSDLLKQMPSMDTEGVVR